jgi:hypothetical protein
MQAGTSRLLANHHLKLLFDIEDGRSAARFFLSAINIFFRFESRPAHYQMEPLLK